MLNEHWGEENNCSVSLFYLKLFLLSVLYSDGQIASLWLGRPGLAPPGSRSVAGAVKLVMEKQNSVAPFDKWHLIGDIVEQYLNINLRPYCPAVESALHGTLSNHGHKRSP